MIGIVLLVPVLLLGPHWPLPLELSDANTTVGFTVDSTWHLVQGKTRNIQGRAWLENPQDAHSVRAELTLPVRLFDTDRASRDERLREVMAESEFPTVQVSIRGDESLCDPKTITEATPCRTTLQSTVTIRGVQKAFPLATLISAAPDGYRVQGELPLRWADFGVEDPSILIAKLKPIVTVSFEVHLRSPEHHA